MNVIKKDKLARERQTWEEESGLLRFLSSINKEVTTFNDMFGFGVYPMAGVPGDIDGDRALPLKVGFILERKNPLLPELTYCLYSLLNDRTLTGHIGMYREGSLQTLKELKPIRDFKKGNVLLYEWMRQLVRASCEKMML